MERQLFTAGEMAKMTGVSLRTVRFYDIKGLLKPVDYTEAGYRLYDQNSFVTLQRIMMLKYLGFSLENIENLLKTDASLDEQLSEQKELLIQKKNEVERVINAIEIAQNATGQEKWKALLHVSNVMSTQEKVIEQYTSSSNLQLRINIHQYSTSEENYFDWVYDRLALKEGMKVYEIGCGTGILWTHNIHKLPNNLDIILSDYSEGMLSQTMKSLSQYQDMLKEKNISIRYEIKDANAIDLPKKSFDLVIANHMLYHVSNLNGCLEAISKSLKKNGRLCCTTIGNTHMKELHDLVEDADTSIKIETPSNNITKNFRLENAKSQLQPHFTNIKCDLEDNDLLVDDVDVIYNYVYSYPGNAPYVLEKEGDKLRAKIQEVIDRDGAFFIHKSTGMFICEN